MTQLPARCVGLPAAMTWHGGRPENWQVNYQSCGWEGDGILIGGLFKPCPECGGRLERR